MTRDPPVTGGRRLHAAAPVERPGHARPRHDERFTSRSGIQWRRLGERLWVGWRDGYPIGLIERGRFYSTLEPLRPAFDDLRGRTGTAAR